jgi:hypothetical protein
MAAMRWMHETYKNHDHAFDLNFGVIFGVLKNDFIQTHSLHLREFKG